AGCWWWLRPSARLEPLRVPPTSTYVVEVGPCVRSRGHTPPGEAVTASGSLPPSGEMAQVDLWRRRALAAEGRVLEVTDAAWARVLPLLAEVLKLRLFRWLTDQRNHLIATQQAGTRQMIEMERRLGELQMQFQVRLQQDQDRIAELEREVAVKERTIRDLLRVQARSQSPSVEP
ncbi:MAG TPA: hypothetical protein VNO52_12945, partial [Methylomirabilota bacterium]|nr:hypothetical protein [Methylomirabilota bacterium]